MGGEPTFVSIDDMDGAEWNFTALGPRKRQLAGALAQASEAALRAGRPAALRPGQVVSGRIAAALGARLLVAARRRADLERRRPRRRRDDRLRPRRVADASRFINALAECLAWTATHVIPAYEDVWHYSGAERRLPVNVDPLKSELKDERSARGWRGSSSRASTASSATCCRSRGAAIPREPGPAGAWFLRTEAPVPDSWRFADRLSVAARLAAVGGAGRHRADTRKPIRLRPWNRSNAGSWRCDERRAAATAHGDRDPAAAATARRISLGRDSHGALRRAA